MLKVCQYFPTRVPLSPNVWQNVIRGLAEIRSLNTTNILQYREKCQISLAASRELWSGNGQYWSNVRTPTTAALFRFCLRMSGFLGTRGVILEVPQWTKHCVTLCFCK